MTLGACALITAGLVFTVSAVGMVRKPAAFGVALLIGWSALAVGMGLAVAPGDQITQAVSGHTNAGTGHPVQSADGASARSRSQGAHDRLGGR